MLFANSREPMDQRKPGHGVASLTRKGTPARGPDFAAPCRARATVTTACKSGLSASIRARPALKSSASDISLRAHNSACAIASRQPRDVQFFIARQRSRARAPMSPDLEIERAPFTDEVREARGGLGDGALFRGRELAKWLHAKSHGPRR